MKFYDLQTKFTFGKYYGIAIKEVLTLQPSYLDWCAINLDHFCLSDEVIIFIEENMQSYRFSEEARIALAQKRKKCFRKKRKIDTCEEYYDDNEDRDTYNYERESFDALTDGQYGDYNDWSGDWDGLRDSMGY